jgi:hypothetical protein
MKILFSFGVVVVLFLSIDPNDFHWLELLLGINAAILLDHIEQRWKA